MDITTWELLSYVVTTIGLPLAIVVFIYEQKKERNNEDEEVYQLLSDNYQDFLKMALGHPTCISSRPSKHRSSTTSSASAC